MRSLIGYSIALVLLGLIILAATPGYEEARLRERMARAHTDLASITIGLEAYSADYGIYPYDGYNYNGYSLPSSPLYWYLPYMMTTPVAYIDSIPTDPFREDVTGFPSPGYLGYRYSSIRSTWGTEYDGWQSSSGLSSYYNVLIGHYGEYRLLSVGPDGTYGPSIGYYPINYPSCPVPYDPTNGTFSTGDIMRSQLIPTELRQ